MRDHLNMEGLHCVLFTLLFINNFKNGISNLARSPCNPSLSICEFNLILDYNTAMIYYGLDDRMFPAVVQETEVKVRNPYDCQVTENLPNEEFQKVVTGDGTYKQLLLYNKTLPGPPIIVYKGQQVVVRLTNNLLAESTVLHFHGIHQRGTPWMDGAGSVSQCPINPGETFTYRFMADHPGTHWYHSHYGLQRTMGAHGPLIILDKTKEDAEKTRVADPLPAIEDEFYLVISDYFHSTSDDILLKVRHESMKFLNGFDVLDGHCYNSTKQSDGLDCGVIPFASGVINGKGRHYPDNLFDASNPQLPLETFFVKQGKNYRFRVICSSMSFGFKLSIDGHVLNIIATDGVDVVTRKVQSVVVFPGERFDFWIEASDPQQLGRYWIRAETMEYYQNGKQISPGHVEAILHYESSTDDLNTDPISEKTTCLGVAPCHMLNCPFAHFNPKENITCVSLTDLQTTDNMPTIQPQPGQNLLQFFLNFHFSWDLVKWQPSISGIQHKPPTAPPQIFPQDYKQHYTACDEKACRPNNSYCLCTHQLDVPLGSVVQLVLLTTVKNPPRESGETISKNPLDGNTHQVHLHGQHFQVLKMAFPSYYNTTGIYQDANEDFFCEDEACSYISWTNASWRNGDIPGLKMDGAVRKDTVNVPVGGYTVVRFLADNPGFWFMHCHTEFHSEEGMALIVKVGDVSEMSPPPGFLSTCGNSDWDSKEFLQKINYVQIQNKINLENVTAVKVQPHASFLDPDSGQLFAYQVACLVLAATTFTLLITLLVMCIKSRSSCNGYNYTRLVTQEEEEPLDSSGSSHSYGTSYKSYRSENTNVDFDFRTMIKPPIKPKPVVKPRPILRQGYHSNVH